MSITGFVPDPEQAATVIDWTHALAEKDEETEFLCLELSYGGQTEQAAREALGESTDETTTLTTIRDPAPVTAVLDHVRKTDPRLLVTGAFSLAEVDGKAQTSDELIRSAACQTLLTLYGAKQPSEIKKILVMTTGGAHDRSALRLMNGFRQDRDLQVTVASIEDETGAKAGRTGERSIQALLHDLGLDPEEFEIKAVVDRLKHRGILTCFEDHDLVLIGRDGTRYVRPLRESLGDAAVTVVKRIPPLQFGARPDWVPRINPSDHADLNHNLRHGSSWGPDFVVMLGLASAIASLGLLQNSPAVVIGSMLLAPLMTPMMGLGLALAQANIKLMRACSRSIGLGFLLTLGVSYLIGVATPFGETLSEEILARGGPNVLDLLIALAAAAAAAYAMARPNLVGAVAGVVIATALVPPACSIGLSLAGGAPLNALGAAVLFLTNLLAIIVASSFIFSALGITASRTLMRHRRIARYGRLGLLALLLVLAGPLSVKLLSQIDEGKIVPVSRPVTRAVSRALHERVARDEGVEIIFMSRPRAERSVTIQIASEYELPASYAEELRAIVREKMNDPDLPVVVSAVRGWWRNTGETLQE